MIAFSCSACQKPIQVHEPFAGKTVHCPECGQVTAVPAEAVRASNLTDFLAPPQAEGELGRLGRYRILKVLGQGGMGVVFQAEDLKLQRIVALKLIHKDRLAKPDAVKRFYREIQAAAALNHPNIVRAYDADQNGSVHFLTMEFVKGSDLSRLVKEHGPLPVVEACAFVRQAALGLQHAAERGLVHRDIKPHNLLLARSDNGAAVLKILDMGLARLTRPGYAEEAASVLTQQGPVMGTLDYIAPEQAVDSHAVDIRADLYSLGCTFYFLLTGRVPFPGGDALAKLLKHQFEQPQPLDDLRADVPAAVAAVVARLMAKNPQDRFQTPAELAETLAAIAARPQPALQAQPPANSLRRAEDAAPFNFRDTNSATQFQETPPSLSRARGPVLLKRLLAGVGVSVIAFLVAVVIFRQPPSAKDDNSGTHVNKEPAAAEKTVPATPLTLLLEPTPKNEQKPALKGWRSKGAVLPLVLSNSSDRVEHIPGRMRPHQVAVHPASEELVGVVWKSPMAGTVRVGGQMTHVHAACGNGVAWWLEHQRPGQARTLAQGTLDRGGAVKVPKQSVKVDKGDLLLLAIDARNGDHACDLTEIGLTVAEDGPAGRVWDLAADVADTIGDANPHADKHGHTEVWSLVKGPSRPSPQTNVFKSVIPPNALLALWREAAAAP